jgi:hypothetical protein
MEAGAGRNKVTLLCLLQCICACRAGPTKRPQSGRIRELD